MPIGTSDGEYFEDRWEYTVRKPVIDPNTTPEFMTNDQNVVTPNQVENNRQLDKSEQDPTTGTGIPIGLKRVPVTGGTIDSTMPLEGSTEPAGALKPDGGSQVPENSPVTNFFNRLSIVNPVKALFAGPNLAEDKAIVTGLYESVKDAFKLPGDVYGGKIDPMSKQGIERAFDLAGLAVLGPVPVAAKMADGTLGSFIGVKARTFDKSKLAEAQIMEKAGASSDDIWKKTGTFKGADGRWRQEINDSKATVDPGKVKYEKSADGVTGPSLEEILDHPELFKAHPSLRTVEIQPFEGGQYGRAAYNSNNDTIQLGKKFTVDDVLHEVQHAIQKREGFAVGGSPASEFALRFEEEMRIAKLEANQLLEYRKSDRFKGWSKEDEGRIQEMKRLFELDTLRKSISFKEAEAQYMRLAGEVEARNVETRSVVSEATTKNIPPWMTEDTARNLQTVINEPMWTTPYGPTRTPGVAPDY